MNEQELLAELKRIVQNYQILQGLKQIVNNAKKDRNGNYHSEKDGKFISKYSYEGQKEMMDYLLISPAEFQYVVSLINTEYFSKYKDLRNITHYIHGFIYKVKNRGFNNYLFYDKIIYDEDKKDDWNL